MKKYSILCALSCILLFCGCDEYNFFDDKNFIAGQDYPVTEEGDDYSITYQYKKSTIVYDSISVNYINHIEADTIIYYERNTPKNYLPKVGSVISSRITNVTPYGLGNKVLSITNEGLYIKCVTTSAALNEIFEKLSFVYDSEIMSKLKDDIEIYDYDKESWVKYKSSESERETRGEADGIDFDIIKIKIPDSKKNGLHLGQIDGSLSIKGKFHAQGNLDNGDFDFYFEPSFNLEGKFSAATGKYDKNLWQDINEFKNKPLDKLMRLFRAPKVDLGAIYVGPLALRPYISAEGYLDRKASGRIGFDIHEKISKRFGYNQKKGSYHSDLSYTPFNEIVDNVTLEGNLGLQLKGIFDFGLGLYVKEVAVELNPKLTLGLFLEGNLSNSFVDDNFDGDLKLCLDFDGGFGGRFVVNFFGVLKLGPEVEFFNFNFLHKEFPLIPRYEPNSMAIAGTDMKGEFDGNFIINSTILSDIVKVIPAVKIYGSLHNPIKTQKVGVPQYCKEDTYVRFHLSGLDYDEFYYVRPCIIYQMFDGTEILFEKNEEYKIYPETKVKILGVRETGHSLADYDCNDGCGAHWAHRFSFDVEMEVIGGANSSECGFCQKYIHDKWGYYNVGNSDGVYTYSHSVLFASENPYLVIYPYYKKYNGEIVVGEQFVTQLGGAADSTRSFKSPSFNRVPMFIDFQKQIKEVNCAPAE